MDSPFERVILVAADAITKFLVHAILDGILGSDALLSSPVEGALLVHTLGYVTSAPCSGRSRPASTCWPREGPPRAAAAWLWEAPAGAALG